MSIQTHYRTCNICEAMCGIEIKHQGKEILSIKGDKNDPLSQGHICPKAVALQDFYKDKDRLRSPIKKTANGEWEEISWEEAIDTVVSKIKKIQEKHGKNALGTYLGNPNAHNLGNILFNPMLLKALGTKNRFSASSVDQLPHHVAAHYMFGNGMLIPIPDIDSKTVRVDVRKAELVLNGNVPNKKIHRLIFKHMESISGIQFVQDHLVISLRGYAKDKSLAQRASRIVKKASLTKAKNIRVKIVNGTASLLGTVTHPMDKEHLENILNNLAGVKKVENKLAITSI